MAKVKDKVISDEQVITTMMTCNSYTETAQELGISRKALYERLKDKDFRILYNQAKAELLRTAVNNANSGLEMALNTVKEIIGDKSIDPNTRLRACDKLIAYASDFTGRLNGLESTIRTQQDPLNTNNWFD